MDLACPDHFAPDTPLLASKNYLDLKHAATNALAPVAKDLASSLRSAVVAMKAVKG